MGKSQSSEWEDYIVSALDGVLKPLGYKRSGRRWLLTRDAMAFQFYLQKSDSCRKDYLRFYVNLAVGSVRLAELQEPLPAWARIKRRFHWGTRLESLLPESTDRSLGWRISTPDDCVLVAQRLIRAVIDIALPSMDEVGSLEKLLVYFRRVLETDQGANDRFLADFRERISLAEEIISDASR